MDQAVPEGIDFLVQSGTDPTDLALVAYLTDRMSLEEAQEVVDRWRLARSRKAFLLGHSRPFQANMRKISNVEAKGIRRW